MKNSKLAILTDDSKIEKVLEKIHDDDIFVFTNYFDVWGNERDGFEVNNLCHEPVYIIGKDWEIDDAVKFLKKIQFLSPRYRFGDPHGDGIEIEYLANSFPIGRFEEHHTDIGDLRDELESYHVKSIYGGCGNMLVNTTKTLNIAVCKNLLQEAK